MQQPADKAKSGTMKRIGELFVESQLLSESDVQKGLDYGKKTGMPLGRVLVMLRLASDADLRAVLHVQQLMKFEGLPGNLAVRALSYMRENKVHIEWAVKKIGWESDKFKKDLPPQLREIKEQIANAEERLGVDHPEIAKMMLQLVDFYIDEKMYAHAEATAEQALEKLEKTFGENDLTVADASLKFSDVLFLQDRFDEAQQLAQRAYEIRAKLIGETHPQTGVALRSLGEVFEMQRRFADAERSYTQALLIAEQTRSLQDIEVLYLLRQLGYVCRRPGRTPDTVLVGNLLADAGMIQADKVPEALAFGRANNVPLVRALVMMNLLSEDALRPVLHAQLLIKSNLIPAVLAVRILRICHHQSVSLEEAMEIAGWRLQTNRKAELGNLLNTHDQLVEAERTLSPDDPQVGALCLRMADLFETYERYADAEPLYKRALTIFENIDGQQEAIAEIMDRLAYVFVKQQKHDLADAVYRKVLELRTQLYGDDNEQVSISYYNLGRLQIARGIPVDAVIWFDEALLLAEKHYGVSHPQVGDIVEQLALAFYEIGDHNRAEPLFWRAYKIKSKYYDVTSYEIVTLLTKLADMYNKDGNYTMADSVLVLFHENKSVSI